MKVSIIIPTYNEKEVLQKCLDSLSKQTYKDIEIIVVDDGSTDGTPNELITLKQDHKGAGAARNLGARNANGDILVFVDADMTFDQDFIRNLTSPMINGLCKGIFSKEEYVSNWDNVWARCWNINEGWEEKRRHPKNYPDHQPVFRAILRTEFDRVGGFTPGGYDDDWSLSKKLGYEAQVAPNAVFYHKNPSTLSEIFNHAKWVGKREYKFGYLGYVIALIRVSFPISLAVGLFKSLAIFNLRTSERCQFSIFKITYDFGIFVGILEYLFGKVSK